MICYPLPQVCSFEHLQCVSNFQSLPIVLELCKNAILVNRGKILINENDRDDLDPNALIGDGDKQLVVFDNQLLVEEGELVLWYESVNDPLFLWEAGWTRNW